MKQFLSASFYSNMIERRDQIDQNISIVQEMNDIVSIYDVRTIFTGLTRFIPMKNIQTWQ